MMRRSSALAFLVVGSWYIAGGSGCGTTDDSCEARQRCGAGGTSTDASGGSAGVSPDGAGCDLSKSPAESMCVVDEAYGVFVSPNANAATADGTRAHPYQSLMTALQSAKTAGKRVYACDDGTGYAEQLVIDAMLDGIGMYGGFSCSDWTYSTTRRASVRAPTTTGVKISKLATGLTVQDFAFRAADATAKGESSIGVFVSESRGVKFSRVTITAGKGAAGDSPPAVTPNAVTGMPGNKGNDACQPAVAPIGGMNTCASETSAGGPGGLGATGSAIGGQGSTGSSTPMVATPAGVGGKGEGDVVAGGQWDCLSTDHGMAQGGAPGPDGVAGVGATSSGTLDAAGWQLTAGAPGKDGHVGQGGGGGGGAKAPSVCGGDAAAPTGASGGSGGGGGCGGKGGGGGGSGGSSMSLVSLNSDVLLDTCDLAAANAGNGGNGAKGQQGGVGGDGGHGGVGSSSKNACSGGKGGDGGNGGNGGGGAGGHSLGIAYVGTQPMINDPMPTVGTAGIGGKDGAGLSTGPGAGAAGKAQANLEIK